MEQSWIVSAPIAITSTAASSLSSPTSVLDGHEAGINWLRIFATLAIGILACLGAIYVIAIKNRVRGPWARSLTGASIWRASGKEEITLLEYRKISPTLDLVRVRDIDTEFLLAVAASGTLVLKQTVHSAPNLEDQANWDKSRAEAVQK